MTAEKELPPLSLQNIHITYVTGRGGVQAVRGVTLDLHAGESLALIGESGSGKTTLGLGIVRLLPDTARVDPEKQAAPGCRSVLHYETYSDKVRANNVTQRRKEAKGQRKTENRSRYK